MRLFCKATMQPNFLLAISSAAAVAKAGGQHSVVGARRTAALEVTEGW